MIGPFNICARCGSSEGIFRLCLECERELIEHFRKLRNSGPALTEEEA